MDGRDNRDGEEEYETSYEIMQDEGEEDSAEELQLADEDESLPWLDSDYDDDDGSVDTGRLIGFALLGLLAIAVLVGGLWWLGNRGTDAELIADGSTIEAPDGPVKSRPEDAGGKQFEGTGNVAPAVGEGQTREGRLAEGNGTPRPSIDAEGTGGASGSRSGGETSTARSAGSEGSTASSSATASGGSSGSYVQVGAYSSKAGAEAGWRTLTGQSTALQGAKYRVVKATVDGGTVYRLQAVSGDAAAARKLCSALKSDGLACQVK